MFDTNADSFTTLEHTFVLDSLSCWRAIYPSHIAFAYITGISGIICMITRLHARLYFLHSWFGKVYIIAMLWATGTSLVIHTKGLPTGVIYSFIWVLVGLTLGWFAITLHMKRVFKGGKWYTGRNRFLNACSEMCTLKAFHGCIMFVSWINIAGRIFVTPLTNDFECSTYPAYKNVKSKIFDYKNGTGIQLVPTHDPNYGRAPWANGEQRWAAIMSIGPYVGAFLTIQMFEADSSLTLEYTFVYDSLSCSRDFYWWHIVFAYITAISGFLCMITRIHPRTRFLHSWLGKLYIIAMLWATATSIVIHNKGLPTGVIYSFLWVMLGLTAGWIAITLHMKGVFKRRQAAYQGSNSFMKALREMLTLKAFHGCVMFVSWINIAGRIFVTPLRNDFECYSQPAFKRISSKHYNYTAGSPIEFVPARDPNYLRAPWANSEQRWATLLSAGPLVAAFVFGLVYLWVSQSRGGGKKEIEVEVDVEDPNFIVSTPSRSA
ncbi:hypothetical protein HDU77_004201 [Chytriomyces hyalinus]|nr:hypothetical protein HDU77_004201 [Chytriomyces hyalinus]